MFFTFALLLATALATRAPRLSFPLRAYFASEFIATGLSEACLHVTGWHSHVYLAVWMTTQAFITLASLVVVWCYDTKWQHWLTGLLGAVGLGWWAFLHMPRPIPFENVVIAVSACRFVWLGMALNFSARFNPERVVLVTIAVMWQLLALMDFGMVLNFHAPYWDKISEMSSYYIVISACAWIAFYQWNRYPTSNSSHPRLQRVPFP